MSTGIVKYTGPYFECVHDDEPNINNRCYICYQLVCPKCWDCNPASVGRKYFYRCQFCIISKNMVTKLNYLNLGDNPVSITFKDFTSCLHDGRNGYCYLCRKILCSTSCSSPSESVDELLGKGGMWYCNKCYRKIKFLDEVKNY